MVCGADRVSGAAGGDSRDRDGLLGNGFAAGANQARADEEDFGLS